MPDYYKKYFKSKESAEQFRIGFKKRYGYKPRLFSLAKGRKIYQRFFVCYTKRIKVS